MEILEENLIIRTVSAVFYYAKILPETKLCLIYCNDVNTWLNFGMVLKPTQDNRYLQLNTLKKKQYLIFLTYEVIFFYHFFAAESSA